MKKSKKDDMNNDITNDLNNEELINDDLHDDLGIDDPLSDGVEENYPDNDDETFDDFNQNEFSELDQFDENTEDSDFKTKSNFDDDLSTEYHGADPDLPAEMSEGQNTKKSILTFLKENWLYATIGLVVIVVAIYLIMGLFSTPSNPAQQTPQQPAAFTSVPNNTPATQQQADQQAVAAADTAVDSDAAPNPAVIATPQTVTTTSGEVTLSDDQLNKLLDGMTKVVEANNKKISTEITQSTQASSNEKLKDLESNVVVLSNNVNQLNQTLGGLQTKLSNTQGQLATLLASETATEERLTLRAVVPGRAWLVDSKGHTISVTEGTPLGVFGTVTNIDTGNNSVTTSSGYVFK